MPTEYLVVMVINIVAVLLVFLWSLRRRRPEAVEADIKAGLERERSCMRCGRLYTLVEQHKSDARDIGEFLRAHPQMTFDRLERIIVRLSRRGQGIEGLSPIVVCSFRFCPECDVQRLDEILKKYEK